MALGQRRMVYTNIWQSPRFARLPDKAKLLYVGLITLADDDGRLRANSLLLRSQVFPLNEEVTQMEVRKWLNLIARAGLVEVYRENEEYFVQHPNWDKFQVIRKELYKASKLPANSTQKSIANDAKKGHKLSKDKLSKEREAPAKPEASISYLKNIPTADLFEMYQRFDASKKQIISKGEDLFFWCETNGKVKKNYKAMLLNALKKDFEERRTDHPLRSSKLVEENGIMKILPKELQGEAKKLIDKMSAKAKE